MKGYYGKPIVKPPEWTDLIPVYFWSGGMGGTSATLALSQRLNGNDALARPMVFVAAGCTALSAFCLIADLKRPDRFLNMLRVFKPTSPMSVGVYIFSAFGTATMAAAACEYFGVAKPVGRAFELLAGLIGPAMSLYTSVLISDTVVPAWFYARGTLPFVFAATCASTAGGAGMAFAPPQASGPARRVAVAGGAAVPVALERLHADLGKEQSRAYGTGQAGSLAHLSRALNISGTVCALAAVKSPALKRAAGVLLMAGGLAERFAVYRAGQASAKDPSYLLNAQREAATR